MQVFDDGWASSVGPVQFEPQQGGQTTVHVSCTDPVELRGVREDGSTVLLHAGTSFRLVASFRSYVGCLLRSRNEVEFGYKVAFDPRQQGEPLNDDNPPSPPMPGANNILAQVRRMMRQEFDRQRMPLLDPENLPFADRYSIDDDDEDFEEEIAASQANERREEQRRGGSQTTPPEAPEARPAPENGPPDSIAAE